MLSYNELRQLLDGRYDAYLVGSGAVCVAQGNHTTPKDWDVIVEGQLPDIVDEAYTFTRFGGRRYPGYNLDIWQSSVADYLTQVPIHEKCLAVHLATGTVLGTHGYFTGVVGRTFRERRALPQWTSDNLLVIHERGRS